MKKTLIFCALALVITACDSGEDNSLQSIVGNTEPEIGEAQSVENPGDEELTPEPEVTAEPEPEVTAEPEPEVTAEPEPEVTAEPEPEVTAEPEPEPEVTAEPESEGSAVNTGPESITDVIVLTGQSNALATHSRLQISEDADEPVASVYAYNQDNGWQVAALNQNWFEYWPVGWERPSRNSAVFHAAKEIVANDPSRVVGLILVAKGDRSIDLWDDGEEMAVALDKHVEKALGNLPHSKTVRLTLWMQGEADGARKDYDTKLDQLITRLRGKWWSNNEMRFICSETYTNAVNSDLMALNGNGDAFTACVEASDQETDDNIHFITPGIRTIGKRMGEKYLQID